MSIVRIDSTTTHGWQARVAVPGRKRRLTLLCSDRVHGGPTQARRAARAAVQLLQLQARAVQRQDLLKALARLVPAGVRS